MKPRNRTLQDRVGQAYHDYGRFCSAHPIACLGVSLITMLVLSYPALMRIRLPASSSIDVHWNDHPVLHPNEAAPEWLSLKPTVFLQQIIIRGVVEPWNSLNLTSEQAVRGPLSRAFHIKSIIQSEESVEENCWHISAPNSAAFLPSKSCLILSPALFWSNIESFAEDTNVVDTIFQPECSPAMCIRDILLGIPTGITGIKKSFQTNRKRSIDYAITVFYAKFDAVARERLIKKLSESIEFTRIQSNEADDTTFVHVFYRPRRIFKDYLPLIISYFVAMLYLYYSAQKFEMVASRWGLAFAAAFTVAVTLLVTTGICIHFDIYVTLWSAEVFPYIALILGLENTICITRSVVNTPPSLDVSSRVAHGLSQEGYRICKYFVVELVFLGAAFLLRIQEIREFCIVAALGIIVDFYMQLFFFAPCLTFDLQRLNLVDKRRFGAMLFSTEIPCLKSYDPCKCPMRKLWPSLFDPTRSKKRTLSDSRLDEKDVSDTVRKAHRRSFSTSKSAALDESEFTPLMTEITSARLRVLYFISRTRIIQRTIIFLFCVWISWVAFVVHSKGTNVVTDYLTSHSVLETAPLEWGEWQRKTYKWWPALFSEYNISLSGQYITFIPPIVLSARIPPNDPLLVHRPPTVVDKVLSQEEATVIPEEVQTQIQWLETQLKMYMVTFWLLLLTSVIAFIVYACLWDKLRALWNPSVAIIKNQLIPTEDIPSGLTEYEILTTKLVGHRFPVECMALKSCEELVSVCHEGRVCLWNLQSGERLLKLNRLRMPRTPEDPPPPVPPQIWSVTIKDDICVLGCSDGSLEIACFTRNKLIGIFHQSKTGITHIELSNNIFILGRLDGTVDFLEVKFTQEAPLRVSSMRLIRSVKVHGAPISHMLMCGPAAVVTSGLDFSIKMFDVFSGEFAMSIFPSKSAILQLEYDDPNTVLLSSCEENTISSWKFPSGSLMKSVHLLDAGPISFALMGESLVTFSPDGQIRIFDKSTGTSQSNFKLSIPDGSLSKNASIISLSNDTVVISIGSAVYFAEPLNKKILSSIDLGTTVGEVLRVDESSVVIISGNTIYRVQLSLLHEE